MAKTTVVQGGVSASATLRSLSVSSSPEAKKAMAKRLKEAAEVVADAARSTSGFSTRIPASIRVIGGTSGVSIRAGGKIAPNAYPFETGARHPLFAPRGSARYTKGPWYPQPKKPFLEEAEAIAIEPAVEAFANVIDDWLAMTGWK